MRGAGERAIVGLFGAAALWLAPGRAQAQPYAFVASAAADAVAVLDLADDSVLAVLPVGGVPSGAAISFDGRRLFLSRAQLDSVAMIDVATGALTSIPVGTSPAGVAVGPRGRRAYVANTGDDTVSVIDPVTASVVATVPVGDAPVEVVAGGPRVYVANGGERTVSVIDTLTNTVTHTLPVGTFPSGLAIHHPTDRLFVANFLDDTVTAIDTASLTVLATVPVRSRPRGLAFDALARRLYVAGFEQGTIDVIDTATNAVTQLAPSGGVNPVDLMLGPGGGRLYVAHFQADSGVRVLDALTLAPIAAIAAPAGPSAFAGFGRLAPPPRTAPDRLRDAFGGWTAAGPPTHRTQRAPASSPNGDVNITDGEFVPSNWQILSSTGPSTAFQETLGGNPGLWRRMSHVGLPSPTEVVHRFVDPSGQYDPAVFGAITSIDASWHRHRVGAGAMAEGLVVVQDGIAYRSSPQTFSAQSWELATWSGLTATDFDDGSGGAPDFSAAGSVLTFGYFRRTPATDATTLHGIDNFAVVIHGGTVGSPGVVGFRERAQTVAAGDPLSVTLERVGGAAGAGTATILVTEGSRSIVHEVTWADGDAAPKAFVLTLGDPVSAGAGTARMRITSVAGTPGIDARRRDGVIFYYRPDWPLASFFLVLEILLSSWSPAWLLAFAVPVLLARRSRWARRARQVLPSLVVVGLTAGLPACFPAHAIDNGSAPEAIFNDRIRQDGQPLAENSSGCIGPDLECLQRSTDPWVGHYRVRDQDVVSEIYPELRTDIETQRLPLSDCLWAPYKQPLRASWEAVIGIDTAWGFGHGIDNGGPELPADADARYGADFYPGALRWFSACRMSTPYDREWLAISPERVCDAFELECPGCTPGPYWAAALGDGFALNIGCNDLGPLSIGMYARRTSVFDVDLRAAAYTDPRPGHNLCAPAAPAPDDASVTSWLTGCPVEGGLLDVCGDKCLFLPERDATLSVGSLYYGRTRALSPTVMTVDRGSGRRLVRPMRRPDAAYIWSTPDSTVRNDAGPPDPEAPGLRWVENFTPDLRVVRVRILHIDGAGVEKALPATRLRVVDPTGAGSVWACEPLQSGDGSTRFEPMSSSTCRNGDGPLSPLVATPTYVVANVTSGNAPLRAPLSWQADLPPSWPANQVFIEFTVENQSCQLPACNALKAEKPELDMGGLQTGHPHRFLLEVTNVGPEPLRIATLRTEAIPGAPDAHADFTLDALSRPQGVPAPLELTPAGELTLAPDFGVNPLVQVTTVGGQPAYVRTLDPDGARITVAGRVVEATGSAKFEEGRLTYTDAAADFPWTPSVAGNRRLFGEVLYLKRQPPFYLDPGHSFFVRVTAAPHAPGNRRARLRVGATANSNPGTWIWAESLLSAKGLSGPSLAFIPSVVSLPRLHLDPAGQLEELWGLNVFVSNYGGVAMQRTGISITGPDAARFRLASTHPASLTIPPGHDERFVVGYTASCAPPQSPVPTHGPRQYEAQLRIETNGGTAVVALRGTWCPQLHAPAIAR